MTLKTIVRAVTPRTRWQAALVSAIVVGSLTAGVSYASTPDSSGVIHACYNNKSGALKVMDTAKTPQCPKGTTSLVWNQTGPPGPVASCAGIPHIGIDLNGCDLEGANLNGDNLTDANFGNADLTDAVLSNAALTGTNLGGTTLTGVQSVT